MTPETRVSCGSAIFGFIVGMIATCIGVIFASHLSIGWH